MIHTPAAPAASPTDGVPPPPPTPLGSRCELTPTRFGPRPAVFAALAVAAGALLFWLLTSPRSQPELIVAVALVVVVIIDGVTAARALRRVDVEVQSPSDALAGHPVTYVVGLSGVRRPVDVAPPPPLAAFGVVVAGEQPVFLTLPSPARGVARHLVLDLQIAGPLGLFRSRRRSRITFTKPLLVGPPPTPHELRWPYLQTVRMGLSPTASHGTDLFRGVRDYVRGDPRRDVHWAATAHHRHLMVKEHEGTGVVSLRIVVTMPFFGLAADEATARAAWLAEEGLRRGWAVRLVTVESVDEQQPVPLLPTGPDVQAIFPPMPTVVRTVDLPVLTPSQVCRRLATAVPGRVQLAGATPSRPEGTYRGATRTITPGGDRWQ
jgi:uncharacterized protein (DUF58 family)